MVGEGRGDVEKVIAIITRTDIFSLFLSARSIINGIRWQFYERNKPLLLLILLPLYSPKNFNRFSVRIFIVLKQQKKPACVDFTSWEMPLKAWRQHSLPHPTPDEWNNL